MLGPAAHRSNLARREGQPADHGRRGKRRVRGQAVQCTRHLQMRWDLCGCGRRPGTNRVHEDVERPARALGRGVALTCAAEPYSAAVRRRSAEIVHHLSRKPAIHGDLDQSQRTRTLDAFRAGSLKLLVASDVAARGLDVPSVSHVFNYDVPSHSEDYVHRIGRTGRAGRDGKAVMICAPSDEKNFDAIEKLINREIPRIENPVKSRAADPKPEPKAKAKAEPKAEAKVDAPVEDAPAQQAAEEKPARSSRSSSSRRSRGGKSGGNSGNASGGQSSRQRDDAVVGMGDHMPQFIAMSFEERRAS